MATKQASDLRVGDTFSFPGEGTFEVLTDAQISEEDGRAYFYARDGKGVEQTHRMQPTWEVET